MSADACWESCPICNGLPEKLRGGYKHLHGQISKVEYERMKKDSVRVDYEYILIADGTLFFTFYAECEVCRAKWKHHGVVK